MDYRRQETLEDFQLVYHPTKVSADGDVYIHSAVSAVDGNSSVLLVSLHALYPLLNECSDCGLCS